MSWLYNCARGAVLVAAVVLLSAPVVVSDAVQLQPGTVIEPAPGRQIGAPITAAYEAPSRSVPTLEELAIGPAGDPLLMAGRMSPAVSVLTEQLPEVDEWAILPGEVAYTGPGTYQVAAGSIPAPDPNLRVRTVLVRVEDGLPIDVDVFADVVLETLNAPQGWRDQLNVSFARTDQQSEANVVLTLATPATTDVLCYPVLTNGRVSCGRTTTVTINANNWLNASEPFLEAGGSLEEYRRYVINHEMGHFLGQPHVSCPAPGRTAPIMLQQTLRLEGCIPNGWPNP